MPRQIPSAAVTFKELKDSYELRIRIPDTQTHSYIIVITEGVLYIYEDIVVASEDNRLLCSYNLPANVVQGQVRALCRNYGLKIIMPKAPANGIIVQVPLIRDMTKR